jgi:hypothetical protein
MPTVCALLAQGTSTRIAAYYGQRPVLRATGVVRAHLKKWGAAVVIQRKWRQRRIRAAVLIQRRWREAIASPYSRVGHRRLLREATEMCSEIEKHVRKFCGKRARNDSSPLDRAMKRMRLA